MEISSKRFNEPESQSTMQCTTYISRFIWKKLFIDCSNYIAIAICIVFILRRLDLLHFSLNNSGPGRSSIVSAKKSFVKSYFVFTNTDISNLFVASKLVLIQTTKYEYI